MSSFSAVDDRGAEPRHLFRRHKEEVHDHTHRLQSSFRPPAAETQRTDRRELWATSCPCKHLKPCCSRHLQTTELPGHAHRDRASAGRATLQIWASDHYSYFDGKLEGVINGVTSAETEQDGCLSGSHPGTKRRWKHIRLSAELKLCFGFRVSHSLDVKLQTITELKGFPSLIIWS